MAKPNLVIKTVMDTKDLKASLEDLKKQQSDLKKEQERANRSQERELDKIIEKQGKLEEKMRNNADSPQLKEWQRQYEELAQDAKRIQEDTEKINRTYDDQTKEMNNQIMNTEELIRKKENQERIEEDIKNKVRDTANNIKKTENKMSGIIKKCIRWAAAIIGIRTLYAAIQRSMSTVSQYNNEMAEKLQAIRYTLAMSLEPIVTKIVDMVYRLVQYVQYFIKAATGYDIFKSANDNLAKAAASAKQLNKSMAGFDTANVLSDSSGSGSESSTASTVKELTDEEVPEWLKKAADYATIIWEKLGEAKDWIVNEGGWKKLAVILGVVVASLILVSIFMKKLIGPEILTGALSLVAVGLSVYLVLESLASVINALAESGMDADDVFLILITTFTTIGALMALITLLGPSMTAGLLPFAAVCALISGILTVMALTLPTILDAAGTFIERVAPKLNEILKTIGENIAKIIYALGTSLPPIIRSVGDLFTKIFNGIAKVISTVGNTISNVMNTTKSLITTVLDKILEFINKLGPAINNLVDGIISAVTKLINFLISGIEYIINNLIIKAINGLITAVANNSIVKAITNALGWKLTGMNNVSIPKFTPRLASGGIVNMPGRGVPVGGAIAGEAGREGVIPLTDRQAMEQLGQEIGRWITLNVDLTTTLDSRILSKRLEKVKSNNSFIRNGG